jgi:hypothetical protein
MTPDVVDALILIGGGAVAGAIGGFTIAILIRPRGRHRRGRRHDVIIDDDDDDI